jgi:predicted  nucleic acid-binding Zn-ribbon protein
MRVTTAEGSITSQASDITSLQSSLTTTDGNVSTNATAITGLDTRLTSAEGTITSQSSDITILQSDITTAEGDISTNATAITGLTTRVTTAEGNITSNSSDITSLQSDVTTAEGNITSNASAISALDTRVTSAEGTITSQASDITTLQSDLTTAEGNISSNATAVSSLTTRVTTAEGNITSNASSITALTSTVNDPTTGLAATAAVASGASTTASANSTSITDLEAEAYLTVSAGGNVSGFKATADASGSSFTIQADRFALVSTDESQTTTPFAVDTTTGTVSFNANVEVDGDLIATGSISGGAIGNGQVDTITVASNAITLSQNQRFTDTTSASSSAYVTHFTSSYFNIDDYTDPVFVRFTSFLYPRASGGGLMVNAYAQANIRTQLLCYNASNTVVQTLTITTSNIYSGAATTNGLTFLNRFTITNSSVVKVKARMQFNKAGGTSDQTALFSGDVEFNVLKR